MSKSSDLLLSPEAELSEAQLVQEAESFSRARSAARLDRRKLITNLSLAAGAAGMLGVAGCSNDGAAPVNVPTAATTPGVLDVLNFALNLEYFEASFYSYIVTGSGLAAANMGSNPGTVTGGAKVTFSGTAVQNIAANLMVEEVQHVVLLRATIAAVFGASTVVSMPSLNLAAAGTINSDATFLAVARQVEGVGVSAYGGGAQYLVSNLAALNYAAQILDVEAQHAGALRQLCIQNNVTSPAADALDQPPSISAIFNTGATTGLNPIRTPQQVLGIVYGVSNPTTTMPAAGTVKGGFFPNGLNGTIYST